MKSFISIFKRSLKVTVLFYFIVCTLFVIGVVIQKWIGPGKFMGTILILLTFFLAIPLGILEQIESTIGFRLAGTLRYADMDSITMYLHIYLQNLIFAVVIAFLFAFMYWAFMTIKCRVKS